MVIDPRALLRCGGMILAAVLAGCGGGGEGGGELPPLPPPAAAGLHRVALPAPVDAVDIEIVDMPDLDLPEVSVRPGQTFAAGVSAEYQDEVLLLHLRSSKSSGTSSPEVETSDGRPGTTAAYLLVTGRDLNEGSVTFSPLTDYMTRRLLAYAERVPAARLRHYQNELAAALIGQDLTGDGVVDYRDALAFDPGNPAHWRRLAFDYQAAVQEPLSGGSSLLQTYATPPIALSAQAEGGASVDVISDALFAVFDPLETVPLPDPNSLPVAVLEFDTDYGGSVRIDEEPGIELNAVNPRLVRRAEINEAAPRRFTLRAVPQTSADMRFARWVGCPQENADGSCTVTAVKDQRVGAQFRLDGDVLVPGIAGVVKLGLYPPDAYTVDMNEAGVLRVAGVSAPELARQLASAGPGHVVATMNWRYPLRRITAVQSGGAGSEMGSSFQFATEDIKIYDVYQAFSAFESGREPGIDDVQSVRLGLDEDNLPQAKSSLLQSAHDPNARSRSVWIAGYGKGLEAGNGFYLVKNPAGKGFALVTAPAGAREVQGAQAKAVTVPLGEYTLGKGSDPVLVGKFKVAMTVDFADSQGSFTFLWSTVGPGFDLRGNMRGNLIVTTAYDLFAGFQGKADFAKSLSTRMCGKGKEAAVGNPKASSPSDLAGRVGKADDDGDDLGRAGAALGEAAEIDVSFCAGPGEPASKGGRGSVDLIEPGKLRLAVQLNNVTPDGLVAPLKLGAGITAKVKGKIGISANFTQRGVYPYDVDLDIGVPCKKFLGATVCAPPGLLGLKSPQRMEGRMGFYSHRKWSVGLVANAEFAPGLDLTLTWGPRSIAESLVTIGGGVSMPMSIVGKLNLLQDSNFPEDVAAQAPWYCAMGYSYAMGQSIRLSVYGKLVPKIEVPVLSLLNYGLDEIEIFNMSHDFDIKHPVLHLPNRKGSGIFSDDSACLPLSERPAKHFPESQRWARGELQWNEPKIVYTRNRKLTMQSDGNMVLYELHRKNGGEGGIASETPLWSTQTYAYPGARAAFNSAGLLTVHDLYEKRRFTTQTPAERLELRADGALVLLDTNGRVIARLGG